MGNLKRKDYEAGLEPMKREFVDLVQRVARTGARIVVLLASTDGRRLPGAFETPSALRA